MKKLIALLLVFVMITGVFAGCDSKKEEKEDSCDHEWESATCSSPRTCTECGATMGKAKSHNWASADCETPKTCSLCGTTDGEAAGHTYTDATCTDPQVCTVCEAIGEDALGHDYSEPTIDTPPTCTRCQHVEGYSLGQPLTSTDVISTTNAPNGNDVVMGNWKDVSGYNHQDTIRFWVKDAEGYTNEESIVFDLSSEYRLIKGSLTLGSDTTAGGSGFFTIYVDGLLAYSSPIIYSDTGTVEFEVDVFEVNRVEIKCGTYSSLDSYLLLDAQVHK